MDAGAALRCGARGGDVVQAPRPNSARLIAALAAVALEAGLAAYAAALRADLAPLLVGIGLLGVVLLAVGLRFSWTPAIPASLALLGAEYAAVLLLRDGGVDAGAPFVGAAALLAAELAYWTAASHAVPLERRLVVRTLVTSAGLALVAFCLGIVLLLVGGARVEGGLPLEALGVTAAAAALAVVVRLARS